MSWPPPDYNPGYGTGYRVTFEDFRQLLLDPLYQPAIAPLLNTWFGYTVVGKDTATTVCSRDGTPVDLYRLHAQIQSDPRRQYELYQRAMDLWR